MKVNLPWRRAPEATPAEGAPDGGPEALEDVRPGDLTVDPRVRDFLDLHKDLECVVTHRGRIFVVSGQATERVERGLADLVLARLGAARVTRVSSLDMQIWNGARRNGGVDRRRAEPPRPRNLTVEQVLGQAVDDAASDVYLDVLREGSRLAFRTYGLKREVRRFGFEEGDALARAMWALGKANYDTSWTCDASFDVVHGGRLYRVRANAVKEYRGNAIVCRVVDPSFVLPLEASGYSAAQTAHIGRMCAAPGGMILVTGETNSGKSTTLRAMLAQLPDTQKIVAVEDPVEVVIDHVNHVEVDRHHSDSEGRFRRLKASLVRQNPDTLMMGEVRDEMSVDAIQDMALQGKRVYTTLHTQSAAAAIPRLALLGVERSLLGLGSFLAGVINQNLVPVVCRACGLDRHPDAATDARHRGLFGGAVRFRNEAGCGECRRGVSGQTLVAEVFALCLDRAGRAQELIAAGKLAALERHMWTVGVDGEACESKHRHAAGKVLSGEIDPALTERIIGEFHRDDVESAKDVVGLQRAVP